MHTDSRDDSRDADDESVTEAPLRLSSPIELVIAVPYLLGFHPRDSLVLVSTQGDVRRRVSLTSRIDLPPPEEESEVVAQLARVVVDQGCDEVLVLVVGGQPTDGALPRPELIQVARAAFGALGVPVTAGIWVPEVAAGVPWRCYDSGVFGWLPDPAASAVAAATVAAGHVTYPDRDDLVALVTPIDAAAVARRSTLLDARCDQACAAEAAADDIARDAYALVRGWVERAGSEPPELGDEDVVDLCLALSDPIVRDAAFGLAIGPLAAGAERLWTVLVREAPDPEAAEPAVLLAYSALRRGNGALVGIALERAQRAWPGHRMSALFQTALEAGNGPDALCDWFAEGAEEARALLDRRGARCGR